MFDHCDRKMAKVSWWRSPGRCSSYLLTDLSKAFDFFDHELSIAKHYAYGFHKDSFINSHLKRRKQRKNQNKFLFETTFNIYICDLLLENCDIDIANYADDNTPYTCSSDLDSVIFKLQKNTERIFRWFYNNNLILNAEKSHLIVNSKENLESEVSSYSIRNEHSVKIFGLHINNNLNFDYHVNKLRKKASKKLHVLATTAKSMNINKRKMLMKAFVSSQFSYCPLVP